MFSNDKDVSKAGLYDREDLLVKNDPSLIFTTLRISLNREPIRSSGWLLNWDFFRFFRGSERPATFQNSVHVFRSFPSIFHIVFENRFDYHSTVHYFTPCQYLLTHTYYKIYFSRRKPARRRLRDALFICYASRRNRRGENFFAAASASILRIQNGGEKLVIDEPWAAAQYCRFVVDVLFAVRRNDILYRSTLEISGK